MSMSPVTGVISLHGRKCWCPRHLSQVSSVCTGACVDVHVTCHRYHQSAQVRCHRCHQSARVQVLMSTLPVTGVTSLHRRKCRCPHLNSHHVNVVYLQNQTFKKTLMLEQLYITMTNSNDDTGRWNEWRSWYLDDIVRLSEQRCTHTSLTHTHSVPAQHQSSSSSSNYHTDRSTIDQSLDLLQWLHSYRTVTAVTSPHISMITAILTMISRTVTACVWSNHYQRRRTCSMLTVHFTELNDLTWQCLKTASRPKHSRHKLHHCHEITLTR